MGLFDKIDKKMKDTITDPNKARDMVNGKGGLFNKIASTAFSEEQREVLNESLDMTENLTQMQAQANNAAQAGVYAATAKVLNITDTGTLIYNNPCCILDLEVTEEGKEPYSYQLNTMVNRMQIPRVGDTVTLGRSEEDPNQLFYIGIAPPM